MTVEINNSKTSDNQVQGGNITTSPEQINQSQSVSASMVKSAYFNFLGLPTELRLEVYSYLLPTREVNSDFLHFGKHKSLREDNQAVTTSILRANKQIYGEVFEALYGNVPYHVTFGSSICREMIESRISYCGTYLHLDQLHTHPVALTMHAVKSLVVVIRDIPSRARSIGPYLNQLKAIVAFLVESDNKIKDVQVVMTVHPSTYEPFTPSEHAQIFLNALVGVKVKNFSVNMKHVDDSYMVNPYPLPHADDQEYREYVRDLTAYVTDLGDNVQPPPSTVILLMRLAFLKFEWYALLDFYIPTADFFHLRWLGGKVADITRDGNIDTFVLAQSKYIHTGAPVRLLALVSTANLGTHLVERSKK